MTTKAIEWIEFQQALTPDKPFFAYFAPGATHAPHHVPQSYIDKQKGRFDQGWDSLRQEIFKRQLDSGVIPKGTKLAAKPVSEWGLLAMTLLLITAGAAISRSRTPAPLVPLS